VFSGVYLVASILITPSPSFSSHTPLLLAFVSLSSRGMPVMTVP